MTPKQAIKFIKDHGFATAQSRAEFKLAIDILEEYVKSKETKDKEEEKHDTNRKT